MKNILAKIILIIFIFLMSLNLFACNDRYNIEQTTYIDSIGIDYSNDQYIVYFHISTSSIILRDGGGAEIKYSIGQASGVTLYDAFNNLSKTILGNLALTHVQSFIFSKSFLTVNNIGFFIEMVKTYDLLTPNFYCYFTDSSIEEIFTVENPDHIPSFFTIINGSITNYNSIYFTEFAKSYYEDFYITKLNIINMLESTWKNEKKEITSVIPIGVLYINSNGEHFVIYEKDYPGIVILTYNYTYTIILDNIKFNIYNQKLTISEKNNIFTVKIRGDFYATNSYVSNQREILEKFQKEMENELNKIIEISKENNFDILNLRNILYRKNKLKNDFDYKIVTIKYDIQYKLIN